MKVSDTPCEYNEGVNAMQKEAVKQNLILEIKTKWLGQEISA